MCILHNISIKIALHVSFKKTLVHNIICSFVSYVYNVNIVNLSLSE